MFVFGFRKYIWPLYHVATHVSASVWFKYHLFEAAFEHELRPLFGCVTDSGLLRVSDLNVQPSTMAQFLVPELYLALLSGGVTHIPPEPHDNDIGPRISFPNNPN